MKRTMLILAILLAMAIIARSQEDGAQRVLNSVLSNTKMNMLWTLVKGADICAGENIPEVWLIQYPCVSEGGGPRAIRQTSLGDGKRRVRKERNMYTLVGAYEEGGYYCLIYGISEHILKCEYNRYTLANDPRGGLILLDIYDGDWKLVRSSLQ